ncbi:retrovirus-related pol polyprotein from transposon TNT 1-94 [Tanacetum coccineum]
MQQPMPNPEDITDPTTAINMALVLMIAQKGNEFGSDRQVLMVGGQWLGISFDSLLGRMLGIRMGIILSTKCQESGCSECSSESGSLESRAEGNANGNQIRCYNCRGLGYLARNCTARPRRRDGAYLQIQGTQTDKAPVYDSDGSVKVQHNDNCYNNDIFNMLTQEEYYTELLEPIPEPHQVPQNDSNVISELSSVEQGGGTVEQHPATVEETRAYFESLYNNLAIEVEKVNMVNRKLRETNADLTTELARYKNQEKCFEN